MKISQNKYDVIVVGAGPAGSMAAYYLAKVGTRILLLEKEKFPRYKTCGGGITYKAKSLIPFDISEIIECECKRAKVVDHDNEQPFLVERDKPVISMVMRSLFDELLAKQAVDAGAELKDGTEVKTIINKRDSIEVESSAGTFVAKFLIAADGCNSTVRRLLKLPPLKKTPALECEVFVSPNDFSGTARFDLGFVPNGYAWVFPKRRHLSIGVLSYSTKINLNEEIKKYLKHIGISTETKIEKHGFTIPCYSGRTVLNLNRVFFCGDAAGLADPVTAEGISNAILSGRLAADSIIQSGFDSHTAGERYAKKVNRMIINELKYSRKLAKVIYSYPVIRKMLFKLNGRKLSELIADIFLNEKQYKKLLTSPTNYFKIFKKYF